MKGIESMATPQQPVLKEVGDRVADRLTVLLGLNALLLEKAFGPIGERQRGALIEMLQTSQELKVILEPLLRNR